MIVHVVHMPHVVTIRGTVVVHCALFADFATTVA